MKAIFAFVWNSEPVALFVFLATIVPLVSSGLVVFEAWAPTAEQLAWTNGVPVALAAALGIKVTRAKVKPTDG